VKTHLTHSLGFCAEIEHVQGTSKLIHFSRKIIKQIDDNPKIYAPEKFIVKCKLQYLSLPMLFLAMLRHLCWFIECHHKELHNFPLTPPPPSTTLFKVIYIYNIKKSLFGHRMCKAKQSSVQNNAAESSLKKFLEHTVFDCTSKKLKVSIHCKRML